MPAAAFETIPSIWVCLLWVQGVLGGMVTAQHHHLLLYQGRLCSGLALGTPGLQPDLPALLFFL